MLWRNDEFDEPLFFFSSLLHKYMKCKKKDKGKYIYFLCAPDITKIKKKKIEISEHVSW